MVRTLTTGQHFGELALLNNMPRSLTIRAKTHCRLLKLDRESFTRILGSIEGHLAKDYGNEFQKRLEGMQGERRVHSEQIDKNFFIDIDLDKGPVSQKVPVPEENINVLEKEKQSWGSDSIGNKS